MALEFLDPTQSGEQTAAPEAVVETVAEPAPQAEAPAQTGEQPRGPDGKFASTSPAPVPEVAAATPAVAEAPPQLAPETLTQPPGFVPLAALHEARERARVAEERLAQHRPAQPPQEAPQPPDRHEDPEGYDQFQENQRVQLNAQWSHRFAVATHGEETVQQAQQWAEQRFDQDPIFRQRSLAAPDPYGFAVAEHQRELALQTLTDPKTLEDFRAWRAQQASPAAAPAAPIPAAVAPLVASVAPLTPAPQAPPRSIASAPSAGGPASVPIGPGQAYDGLFHKG